MFIKIYGKQNCNYCTLAKAFLDKKNIPYSYESVDTEEAKQRLFETVSQDIKTVPVVVIDDQWIGGYNELQTYINETNPVVFEGKIYNGTLTE